MKTKGVVCMTCHTPIKIGDNGKWSTTFHETGWHCTDCIESEAQYFDVVKDVEADDERRAAASEPVTKPTTTYQGGTTTSITQGSNTATKTTYVPCDHNLTPLIVPEGPTIYLTAHSSYHKPTQGPAPDAAAYLDPIWLKGVGMFSTDGAVTLDKSLLPILFMDWPDMKGIELAHLEIGVNWIRKYIEAGKNVEIGCIGGHGRTGTLAAAVLISYGWLAWKAAFFVRACYCKKAIETVAQEQLLVAYDSKVNGTKYANKS